uniref:Nuclear factor of kappa light polypeptide gene enhancer in B-cells inhibitor, zeta n=1 Tax=Kryptolebias marmoratus TaxID=37003 RepID=A0A3Q2ZM49_KRYMA
MPSPPALVNPNAAATFAPYVPENVFVSTFWSFINHVYYFCSCLLVGRDHQLLPKSRLLAFFSLRKSMEGNWTLLTLYCNRLFRFLHIAVAQGRRALAYVLAAKMARCGSLDTKEHNGQTALQIAAATNQHLILCDLLSHSAQINIRDLWGRSPLHVCAEKGYFHSLQVKPRCHATRHLLNLRSDQLADVEMFNYDGLTPLHVAVLSHNAVVKEMRKLENPCSYMTSELAHKRRMYVECIRTLMHMGASYGASQTQRVGSAANPKRSPRWFQTFSGNTALHIVSSLQSYKGQVEAVKLLMRKGADPGARNYENELPCQLVPEGPVGEKVSFVLLTRSFFPGLCSTKQENEGTAALTGKEVLYFHN